MTESVIRASDDEVLEHHDSFYIQATSSRTDDRTRVLKHGETFAVFDRHGDVQPVGLGEQGSTTTARGSCRASSCGSAAGARCCSARR